jgi:hypothetical protein
MTKYEERKAQREAQKAAEAELLANSDSYIDFTLDIEEEKESITKLDNIITRVNQIAPVVTNTGEKYTIQCYPVSEYLFGLVGARLLALVNVTGSMFTNERQRELTAITGIDYITWTKASNALGKPMYFSKGAVSTPVPADIQELIKAMTIIAITLGIPTRQIAGINEVTINKYFLNQEIKATEKEAEFNKSQAILTDNNRLVVKD